MVKVGLLIQRRPNSRPTDHMAHAHTERYRRWQQLGPKHQDKNSSRKVQVQSSSRQLQKPSSKNMQQTNMLWSSAAGVSHMAMPSFSWPLTATSLDHLHTLVQQGYNNVQFTHKNVQDKYKNVARPSQKKEQWKLSTSWTAELQNHDNWKTLQQSPMSPHVSSCMQVASN